MSATCRIYQVHRERVEKVKEKIPRDETLLEVSDLFDALGNPTRLKILFALLHDELCTCDLHNITGLSISAISHQLRILKDRRIVEYRREGKNVYYRLVDDHIKNLLRIALEHVGEKLG